MATISLDGVDHRVGGAQVVLLREGRVFLQLRAWPPGWELPGGHLEGREHPAACAQREVEEETGYRVRIRGLAGVYSWTGLRTAGDAVYWGEVVGGCWRRSIEGIAGRFVDPLHLPRATFPWHHDRINDALAVADGAAPVHRVQMVTPRHVLFFGGRWLATFVDRVRRLAGGRR